MSSAPGGELRSIPCVTYPGSDGAGWLVFAPVGYERRSPQLRTLASAAFSFSLLVGAGLALELRVTTPDAHHHLPLQVLERLSAEQLGSLGARAGFWSPLMRSCLLHNRDLSALYRCRLGVGPVHEESTPSATICWSYPSP